MGVSSINQIIDGKEKIKSINESNIENAITKDSDKKILNLNQKMLEIPREVLKKANSKEDHTKLALKLEELREEKNENMLKEAENEILKERLKELKEFLEL